MTTRHQFGRARTCAFRLFATLAIVAGTTAVVGPASTAFAAPPVATTTVTAPAVDPLLAESSTFTVTFDNTDTSAVGYSPYIDIRINTAGADGAGAATDDGLMVATMKFLGSAVPASTPAGVVCTGSNVTHPITLLPVTCPVGQKLFVFPLPFGSFAPNQPVAVLDTAVTMSNLADVNFALSLSATPGFALGDSPTGSAPITGTLKTANVTPRIARLAKSYVGPENETATGPNFPQAYVLAADLPNAVVFTSVQIDDALPDTHQFNAVTSALPAPSSSADPSTSVPGGTLTRQWNSLTGGTGTSDASVRYSFHVPQLDRLGLPVLDPSTGNDVATVNDSSLTVTYTPVDIRDAATTVAVNPNTTDNHTLIAKSIAIQKSSTIVNNLGSSGFNAGDTLEYTISGQVSDYFSYGAIVVSDTLGDGQTFVPGSATYTSTSEGVATPAVGSNAFGVADLDVDATARTTCGVGTTAITFDLSDALVAAEASGVVVGGLVHTPPNRGAATFRITFQALVSDEYACAVADLSVDEGDHIDNGVTVAARMHDAAGVEMVDGETDDSSTTRPIETAPVTKTAYAKNGVVGPFTTAAAGDLITYRIQTASPSTDFESLKLTDFLPLPAFSVATFSTSPVSTSCATPVQDQACYGPADTLHDNAAAPDPLVTIDTVSNSITFDYRSFDDATNQPTAIDLLLSVRLTSAAYRDGLLFTNEVLKQYSNSFGTASTAANVVPLVLTEPVLDVVKGVASTNNASITLAASSTRNPTGVTWSAPSTGTTPGFSSTITTAGLSGGAPNSNAVNADAGDLVRFAIVVENTGSGTSGAFDVAINDTFPAGFVVPVAGIRLFVANGARSALAYTATGAFVAAAGTGGNQTGTITLTDGATGSLAAGKTGVVNNTTGTNIAVITYELEVADTAVANTVHTNTTNLTGFSGSEGGGNFIALVLAANKTNVATVTTAAVTPLKSVFSSDRAYTSLNRLAIGEVVTYDAVLTIPEGITQAVVLSDALDVGQAIVSIDSIAHSAAVSSAIDFPDALVNARAALVSPGSAMTVNFGDVTNTDRVNTVAETITVRYSAIVLNVPTNRINLNKINTITVRYTGNAAGTTAVVGITVVEPVLITEKSATPTTADADDVVTFVIDVHHSGVPSESDAFEVTTVDVVPAGLTYVAGSLNSVAGSIAPTDLDIAGATITATWPSLTLSPSQIGRFTYQAVVDAGIHAPSDITNTATTSWTSVPGAAATTAFNTNDTERTGAGGTLNNYFGSGAVTISVANAEIVKSLFATDDASTAANDLTIGESATYQLRVSLPEASIPAIEIEDIIPSGMRYVAGSATLIKTVAGSDGELTDDFAGTLGADSVVVSTVGTTDTLDFEIAATTIVDPDNDLTNNSILLRFDAIVANVPANVGSPTNTTLDNTATVQIAGGDVVTSNHVVVDVVEPQLGITKTFTTNDATPGSVATFSIAVQNDGLSDGFDTVVTDTLDPRFDPSTFNAVPVAGWTFSRSGSQLTWTSNPGVALPHGEMVELVSSVGLYATNVAGDTIPNTATAVTSTRVGTPGGERTEPLVSSLAILGVVTPDLSVDKNDGVATAVPGQSNTYVVTTSNVGGAPARNSTLTDTLPAGSTYVGATGACTLDALNSSPSVKKFVLGTIAAGASSSCLVTVTIDNPAPAGTTAYVNTAVVAEDGTNGADPVPRNNTSVDTDTVVAHPDLAVTKTNGVDALSPGAHTEYEITVTNTGNIGATNILIRDTLPSGFVYGSCTNVSGSFESPCDVSGGIVSSTITSLAGGGATATLTIEGTIIDVPAPAGLDVIVNTVDIVDDGSNGADPTVDDHSAFDSDPLDANPDIVVTKNDHETVAVPGQTLTYTITVANDGAQDATGVELVDTLPDGVELVDAPNTGIGAGVQSGATVVWPAFDLPIGATETMTVTVLVDAPAAAGRDDLTNSAAAFDDGSNGVDPTPADNTAVDVDVLDAAPDLVVAKNDDLDAVVAGTPVTYTIDVTNIGTQDATGVELVDTLPDGVDFVDATGGIVPIAGVLTWPVFDLEVGSTATFLVRVVVTDPVAAGVDALTNSASVADDAANGPDLNPDDNFSADVDSVLAAPNLSITKTDGGTEVVPGQLVTYTLTVMNSGNQDATGVVIVDAVPLGTSFVDAPANAPVGAGSDGGDGEIVWPAFDLAVGDVVVVTVVFVVDAAVPAGLESVQNVAAVYDDHANGPDSDLDDNLAFDADDLVAVPDLVITKTDGRSSVRPGDTLTYTLTVSNVGDQDSSGVTIVDTLPVGTEFVSASDSGTLTAGVVSWGAVPLDAGDTLTRTVVVTVAMPFTSGQLTLHNVADVDDDHIGGPDPTPADNSATDSDAVDNTLDLGITKSNGTETSTSGTYTTWQLTITNNGPAPVAHFKVVDTVPAQLSDVTYQPSSGTYDAVSGTWTGPPIAANQSVVIAVTGLIAADAVGTLVNRATVSPLDGLVDPTPDDNAASDTDTLVATSGLSFTKVAADPTATLGTTMIYTIKVTNLGPSVATQVSVVDAMPIGLRYERMIDDSGWTCTIAAPSVVTCALDDPLPVGASAEFKVEATSLLVGDVRNVAVLSASSAGEGFSPTAVADIRVSALPPAVPAPASPLPSPLPRTGADLWRIAGPATVSVGGGMILLLAARRRRTLRRADPS